MSSEASCGIVCLIIYSILLKPYLSLIVPMQYQLIHRNANKKYMLRVGPRQRIVRNNWRGFGKAVLVCANRENVVAVVIHQFKDTF